MNWIAVTLALGGSCLAFAGQPEKAMAAIAMAVVVMIIDVRNTMP